MGISLISLILHLTRSSVGSSLLPETQDSVLAGRIGKKMF